MTDERFWGLTPKLFGLLCERRRQDQRRMDRRAGEAAVAIYNVYRDAKKNPDPWDWTDVFTEHREPEEPQTEDDMLRTMNLWAGHVDEAE